MKVITALLIASIFPVVLGSQETRNASRANGIQVNLFVERNLYKPGETIRVRVEIKNISDHAILVGREMSSIGNWPFSIWLRFVDPSGQYARPVRGAYIDPPPKPDLSQKNGVLRWWTTLEPGYFYGKEVDFPLEQLRPGHYELRGEYYSVGLLSEDEFDPKNIGSAKTPAFAGKVELQPVSIEVLPGVTL